MKIRIVFALLILSAGLGLVPAHASSHREAPFITKKPKVDGTDFYMFNSYEAGRAGYVTIVANYLPLQDPYGGPNYFKLDPDALYEIHIDNDGDAVENMTFQFQFQTPLADNQSRWAARRCRFRWSERSADVATLDSSALNVTETYTVA